MCAWTVFSLQLLVDVPSLKWIIYDDRNVFSTSNITVDANLNWVDMYFYVKLFLLRPGRGAEYCDQPLCLCVCPRAYLWDCWTDQQEILCADPLWPWLGPSPAALCFVMYFQFYGPYECART